MKVLIENTTYSLLVYTLLFKEWENTIFILKENTIPKEVIDRIQKTSKVYRYKVEQSNNKFANYYYYYKRILKYYYFLKKNNIKDKVIYGSDHDEMSRIVNKKNFILIEDGSANYQPLNDLRKNLHDKKVRKKISSIIKLQFKNINYLPFGYDEKIKKVYLTRMFEIPKELKEKAEIINIKRLWKSKTQLEKSKILNLFNFNEKLYEDKKIILLTQTLSEDNWCSSESRKIEIYKEVLSNYNPRDVIIKMHPRETTNYKKIFPNITVDSNRYPFELLNLIDLKVDTVVTLFSGAALNFRGMADIYFLGTQSYTDLEKGCGKSFESKVFSREDEICQNIKN